MKDGKDERDSKNTVSLSIKIAIASFIISLVRFLLDTLFKTELPRVIFFVVFCIMVFRLGYLIAKVEKNIRKCDSAYNRKIEILKSQCKSEIQERGYARTDFGILSYDLAEERKRKKKAVYDHWKNKFLLWFIAIIVLLWSNKNNARACIGDLCILMGVSERTEQTEQMDSDEGTDFKQDEPEIQPPAEAKLMKPQGYRFILEEPDKTMDLEWEVEEQVFFLNQQGSGLTLEEYVEQVMETIYGCRYTGVNKQSVVFVDEAGEKCDYYTYTSAEDAFKRDVEFARKETYYVDWLAAAPKSSELEAYLSGRERLNTVLMDGQRGCYELWWLLANDYQYYVQEYEVQTQNKDAILYYYAKSIYCCMKALEYEMPEEKREDIYHYMVMRYHDIYRDDANISGAYKKLAEEIWECLKEDDTKMPRNRDD